MQLSQRSFARGGVNPVLVVGIVLALAAVAVGAWYLLRSDGSTTPTNVEVTVDGKKVDPNTVLKGGTVQLAGGGSFTIAKDQINPASIMGGLFKEYFALPEGPARTKFLDEHIDKQEAIRRKMEFTPDSSGEPQVKVASGKPGETGPTQKITIKARGDSGDSMPPELKAQVAEFAAAVAKRRAERGLPPQQGIMIMRTKESK